MSVIDEVSHDNESVSRRSSIKSIVEQRKRKWAEMHNRHQIRRSDDYKDAADPSTKENDNQYVIKR